MGGRIIRRHLNLLSIAAENVSRNFPGYTIAAAGLVLGLTLFLSGVAISEGLKAEARDAIDVGADVYCTWDMFGRDAAVPNDKIDAIRRIDGVIRVVPRIVGRIQIGNELPIVIGVPLAVLENEQLVVEGRVPSSEEELLIGRELARTINKGVGDSILLEADLNRVFTIAGVTSTTSALWSAKAVVCDIEEAQILFGESGHVSDVCIYTRPDYELLVAEAVGRLNTRFRVQTKALVDSYVMKGMTIREGVFTVLVALVLALAIPSFAVMTYMGSTPRRREIGLLKADGWRTSDVLEMVAWENILVSMLSACGSLLFAMIWVRLLSAPLVASFFIADLPTFPEIVIPSLFFPLPVICAFVFSVAVTMSGSIYATWRTSITKPVEVLR